ncbi:MAG: hypothetical protein LBK62_02425 [Treponema sp.]|jgi:hypothetical protein|nr:hypothetical protein [Treponema sp.]
MKSSFLFAAGLFVVAVTFGSCATQVYLNAAGEPFERSSFSLFGQKTDHFTEKVETGREVISERIIEEDRFEQQITNQAAINAATQQRTAEERAQERWFQDGRNYRAAFESKYSDPIARMAATNNDQRYQYYMNSRNAPAVTTTIPQPQYTKIKVGVNRIKVIRYRIQYQITTYYLESTGKLPTVETTVEETEERGTVS